ncbi:hypothetical protein LUZ60_000241 [Juncus effusus]|nr:hypothetical protein LUZ60_000241 [Juncus effusus]
MEPDQMEPYELKFCDLLLLSSHSQSPPSQSRLNSISASIMEALGPSGPGFLAVSNVPFVSSLRKSLLPLAQNLAFLRPKDRAAVLKKHGLGSDVNLKKPDRSVSSFARLLNYTEESVLDKAQENETNNGINGNKEEITCRHSFHELDESEFDHLGETFRKLGLCMMELGLRLSRVCDNALKINELEQSIIASGSAKGRLIHYHSNLDGLILKGSIERSKGAKMKKIAFNSISKEMSSVKELWQQWHYDYGIFTVLTSPLFLSSFIEGETLVTKECPAPNGHSCLQLFNKRKNRVFSVKYPADSFIIQVGEAADVLSRGKLRSTLHSVCRPFSLNGDISRETFVVFLQPSWGKILRNYEFSSHENEEEMKEGDEFWEIFSKIPPLSGRLRDGMTFAEFSRETTKQYYGSSGTQNS